MWMVGNLWISEASLSQQEKLQCSSHLPNIKYNCVLLFFESIVLGIYLWVKIYFLIDTNAKMWTEFTDIVIFRKRLLKFLQGEKGASRWQPPLDLDQIISFYNKN